MSSASTTMQVVFPKCSGNLKLDFWKELIQGGKLVQANSHILGVPFYKTIGFMITKGAGTKKNTTLITFFLEDCGVISKIMIPPMNTICVKTMRQGKISDTCVSPCNILFLC